MLLLQQLVLLLQELLLLELQLLLLLLQARGGGGGARHVQQGPSRLQHPSRLLLQGKSVGGGGGVGVGGRKQFVVTRHEARGRGVPQKAAGSLEGYGRLVQQQHA